MDTLIEEVKKSEGICIIPAGAIEMVLTANKDLQMETRNLNTRVNRTIETVEKLTERLEASNTQNQNTISE